jgi:hypothetical protein
MLVILLLQPGIPMDSSVTAMSHALEELVGHVDRLQRSPLFTHFRLEQGADQRIYRRFAPRPSRDKTDVLMLKGAIPSSFILRPLDDCPALKLPSKALTRGTSGRAPQHHGGIQFPWTDTARMIGRHDSKGFWIHTH